LGGNIFKNILVAIDGSENSRKAAKKGIEIALQNNAKIYVLYVIDLNLVEDLVRMQGKNKSEIKTQLVEKAKIYVKDIQKLSEESNLESIEIIEEGNVVNEILKEVKKHKIDLMVMAHHSRTGAEAIRMGSVCSGVLEFTPCPVLIVK
jgi:nucleotide-binding universal stress UspA family protein